MLTKKVVALAKWESTEGTTRCMAAASDAFEIISDLTIDPESTLIPRAPYSNSISPVQNLLGQRWAVASFVTEMKGSETTGSMIAGIDSLLKSCGLVDSITAGTSVTFAPVSSSFTSCSAQFFVDGQVHTMVAMKGNAKMLFTVGETAKLQFDMLGIYQAPTACTIVSPTLDTTVPPVVLGVIFTFDGTTTFSVQQVELDLGNIMGNRDDMTQPTGIKGFEITAREGAGSFNPEAVLTSTYDFWDIWENSTEKTLSIVLGEITGNMCTITCPKVVVEKIAYGDRNGIRIFDIPFKLGRNSGDDEINIKYH